MISITKTTALPVEKALKIKIQFGYSYLLFDNTPENLALAAHLACQPIYEHTYDSNYDLAAYAVTERDIAVSIEQVNVTPLSYKEWNDITQAEREEKAAAKLAERQRVERELEEAMTPSDDRQAAA